MIRTPTKIDLHNQVLRDIQEEWDHCDPPYYFTENQMRVGKPVVREKRTPVPEQAKYLQAQINYLRNNITELKSSKAKPTYTVEK